MTASITFSEYTASQEAKGNIANAILGHSYALCEALRQNYIQYSIKSHERSIENLNYTYDTTDSVQTQYHQNAIARLKEGYCDYEYVIETGRKYHKVIMNANGSRSVHCFIDKATGEVYKPASFKSPAKGVRFDLRIIEQREWLFENATWSGGYLYKRG